MQRAAPSWPPLFRGRPHTARFPRARRTWVPERTRIALRARLRIVLSGELFPLLQFIQQNFYLLIAFEHSKTILQRVAGREFRASLVHRLLDADAGLVPVDRSRALVCARGSAGLLRLADGAIASDVLRSAVRSGRGFR